MVLKDLVLNSVEDTGNYWLNKTQRIMTLPDYEIYCDSQVCNWYIQPDDKAPEGYYIIVCLV